MIDSLVWVIALPLFGALLTVLRPGSAGTIGIASVLATAVAAGATIGVVATEGKVEYAIGGWSPGLGIALRADGLSVVLLVMTALVALAISIYATGYFRQQARQRRTIPPAPGSRTG